MLYNISPVENCTIYEAYKRNKKMINKKEENRVVDQLDDKWQDVITFLKNNKDVNGLEPLSFFTETICKFKFDKHRCNSAKTILSFSHSTGELDMKTVPWRPCERSVRFVQRDKEAAICVMSKVKDEDVVFEQALKLAEDGSGNWHGQLNRLNGKGQNEKYEFDISRHGYVKSRTFKLTSLKSMEQDKLEKNKNSSENAKERSLK